MIDIVKLRERLEFEAAARGYKLNAMYVVTVIDDGSHQGTNQREMMGLLASAESEADVARLIVADVAAVFKAHEPEAMAAEIVSLREQLAAERARNKSR